MRNKYNILAIAYAFEPNKGSEPEVGWKTILELSKYNKVVVITRKNNKENIESKIKTNKDAFNNIEIIYYDLPKIFINIKKYIKLNQIYYFIWQIALATKIKNICREYSIDLCHHITFATIKVFSAGAFSGVPFIFGPVGGGERASYKFYKNIKNKFIIKEIIRDIDIKLCKYNPLNLYTYYKANKIFVTTNESMNILPKRYRSKCEVMQTIAIDNMIEEETKTWDDNLTLLYVGNLLYWKGTNIIVDTLSAIDNLNVNFKMQIVGDGDQKDLIREKCKLYGIDSKVEFLGKLPREQVLNMYKDAHILFFPSLHDSGGMVVLEAMSKGTPTICLNYGGPAVNVLNNINGVIVDGLDYDDIVYNLATSIKYLNDNRDKLKELSSSCLKNLEYYSWSKKIKKMMSSYSKILNE